MSSDPTPEPVTRQMMLDRWRHKPRKKRWPGRRLIDWADGTMRCARFWLIPWDKRSFPGTIAHMRHTLGRTVGWRAVLRWETGDRRVPAWAADALADEIELRVAEGVRIAAALRELAEADRRHVKFVPASGFHRVSEATGRSGRSWDRKRPPDGG